MPFILVLTWKVIHLKILGGDHAASGHIFIHQYEIPEDGWVSGVFYLNDSEWFRAEIQESVTLLILRPTENGWLIVHTVELPADDQPIDQNRNFYSLF